MAITGKFVADFTDFDRGVQGSGTKLREFEGDTKKAGSAIGDMQKAARGLATDLLAMFSVRAAVTFANDVVASASALKDLSQQTHMSVEEIQTLASAMSEFGVDQDTLAKGLFTLSRKIAGDPGSVAGALATMGIAIKDVQGLNGRELFLRIMDGLATLQGGLRDSTASDLFGSKLGMAMAGASEGIRGALGDAEKFGNYLSTGAVDALDKYDEALTRANKNLGAMAGNLMGPVAEGFNVLFDAANKGVSMWSIAMSFLPKGLGLIGTSTTDLGNLIADLNTKTTANVTVNRERVAVLTAEQQAARFLAILEGNAAEALTAAQLKNLGHLKEIGQLTAKNAEGIGVSTAQFEKYKASIERAKDAATALAKTEREAEEFRKVRWKQQLDLEEKIIASTAKQTAAYLRLRNEGVMAELEAQTALNKVWGLDAAGAIAHQVTAIETLEIKLHELHILQAQGQDIVKRAALAQQEYGDALMAEAVADDNARNARAAGNTELVKVPPIARAAGSSIIDLADTFNRAAGVIIGGLTNVAAASAPRHMRTGENPMETMAEFVSRTTVATGMRKFAAGGPVLQDGPIYAHAGEYVIPKGGGGGTTIINITQPLGTASQIAAAVKQALAHAHMSGGGRMPA